MTTGLVVAIDDPDIHAAEMLAKHIGNKVAALKVGLTLFTAHGQRAIEALGAHGELFCDFKLHDIPHQVRGAAIALADHGIWMFTVHLSGGLEMVRAAVEGSLEGLGRKPVVAGVTVLTSLDGHGLSSVGQGDDIALQVERLARLGAAAGVGALVCSAHEIELVRKTVGSEIRTVVPGIRVAGDSSQDQARVLTPRAAALAGADFIVVGRSITEAPNPADATLRILEEIAPAG